MATAHTVLIAEDEALIRMDLREMLTEAGYHVVAEAADGLEAVEHARTLQPDVVLLDVKMPGMSGIDAAKQISAETSSAIVMLTAFSQRDLMEQARRAGASAYLVKPFQKPDLLAALAKAAPSTTAGTEASPDAGAIVRKAVDAVVAADGLTARQAERMLREQAASEGRTMRAVAESVLRDRS